MTEVVQDKGLVVIIDDEHSVRALLNACLEEAFEVVLAGNGEQGLAKIRDHKPDLVLLDIGMPDINGYRLCEMLSADPETQHIPIIFITAFNAPEDESRGLAAGAVDYIVKPFNPLLVRARVSTHVALKRQRDHLRSLSRIDGLTGLANRRALDEYLTSEWQRAARGSTALGFVLIDIDSFKAYNDTRGHMQGDECLRAVALAMRDVVRRPADLVARYGGEEFAVVLPESGHRAVGVLAMRLCDAVARVRLPHGASATAAWVTVSAGAATMVPGAGDGVETLVALADKRLYDAKRDGGNRARFE